MLSNGAGLHALPATQLEKKNLKKRSDNLVFKTSVKIGTICVFWKVDLSVLDLTSYEPHFVDTRLPSLKHFFEQQNQSQWCCMQMPPFNGVDLQFQNHTAEKQPLPFLGVACQNVYQMRTECAANGPITTSTSWALG